MNEKVEPGEERETWGGACPQYISNKRPSRFVILSAAQDDTPEAASFEAHIVLFEMY